MLPGIDVAFYEPLVDWKRVKADGKEFVFIKSSQSTFTDSKFHDHWKGARGIIPRSPYHFYDPRYDSPKEQADYFLNLIRDDPGELPPTVDIELYIVGPYHGATYWYDFISRVRDGVGKYPFLYTAYYYWNDNVKIKPVNDKTWFKNCPLWVANYYTPFPLVPAPWTEWAFWQYSGEGIVDGVTDSLGRLTECDLDYYNGTKEDMYSRFAIQLPSEETPMTERYSTTNLYNDMALRPNHSTANVAIARYAAGQTWYGDLIYIVPEDVYSASSVKIQYRGDKWLHVTRINSTPVDGWVALIHKGTAYCSNPIDNGPSGEPVLTHTIEVFNDGSLKIDGNAA
jgi:GH25 family lysozyme M1 (1,4-beta-N-acetylmuramidase)